MENENLNETQNGNSVKADVIRSKWLALSDDEKNILGRPNFACASIAHRMRDMGFEVATKAEAEHFVNGDSSHWIEYIPPRVATIDVEEAPF